MRSIGRLPDRFVSRWRLLVGLGAALISVVQAPARAQSPAASGDTLEITGQRIDQLLQGLAGEQTLRDRIAGSTGAVAQQHPGQPSSADIARAEACGRAAMQRQDSLRKANPGDMDARAAASAQRDADKKAKRSSQDAIRGMQKAAASGDPATLQRYQDSLQQSFRDASTRAAAMMGGGGCAPVAANASPGELAQIDSAGAKASGLPLGQYVAFRGRIATYFRTGGVGGEGVAYSLAERDVMLRRGRDLSKYAMLLAGMPRQ